MTIAWTADDYLREECEQDARLTCEDAEDWEECEKCGRLTVELVTVSNCSPAEGVHETARICAACAVHYRNRCGSCA